MKVLNDPPPDCKREWCHETREQVRAHLCDHEDIRVRPHCNNDVADVASVPSHVHARGFLYHHIHVQDIVPCLIQIFGLQNPNYV